MLWPLEAKRRLPWPSFTVAGLAALLAFGNGLRLKNESTWYEIKPVAWVIADAHPADAKLASRGWTELKRRRRVGRISATDEAAIDRLAQAEHNKPIGAGGPLHRERIDHLEDRLLAGELAEQQRDQFLADAVRLTFRVRPVVQTGRPVPYRLEMASDPPRYYESRRWRHEQAEFSVAIDDQLLDGSVTGYGTDWPSRSQSSLLPAVPAGKHVARVRVRISMHQGSLELKSAPFLARTYELQAPFEVVEKLPATDRVEAKSDDLLHNAMKDAIKIRGLGFGRFDEEETNSSSRFELSVTNPPATAGFRIFVEVDGQPIPVGDQIIQAGRSTGYTQSAENIAPYPGRRVQVVLRSDPSVSETPSIFTKRGWAKFALPTCLSSLKAKSRTGPSLVQPRSL